MDIFESVGRAMVSENVAHDEFRLEIEDGWVHLLDGEQSVRVSMPKDVWDQLIRKYLNK